MNIREHVNQLFAVGTYYWLVGEERQSNMYWHLANQVWLWRSLWNKPRNYMQDHTYES
jgi:hypothetical protein